MTGGECERRMGGRAYRSEYASDNVNGDMLEKKNVQLNETGSGGVKYMDKTY